MVPARFGGGFFNGNATCHFVVNGSLEFFPHARVFGRDARGENILIVIEKFSRDFNDLLRGFSRAENHFRKTLAQGAMGVYLRKTEVGHESGL